MTLVVALISLGALFGILTYCRTSAVRTLAITLLSMLMVPYWVGAEIGIQVPGVVVIVLLMIATLKLSDPPPLMLPDLAVGGLALAVLAGFILGITPFYDAAVMLAQWVAPYLLGRFIGRSCSLPSLTSPFVAFAALLSVLTIAEFLFNWHPFVNIGAGTNSFATWSQIQVRAGLPRSEWTFGHSIALGNVLAMTIPFVVFDRMSFQRKIVLLTLIFAAVTVTFSRSAMIAAALTSVMSFILLRQHLPRKQFAASIGLSVFLLGAMLSVLSQVSQASGAETAESSSARVVQLDLAKRVEVLGVSDAAVLLPDGSWGYLSGAYVRGFTPTVDNTPLLLGLRSGWVPVGFWVASIVSICILQCRLAGRSPAGIAVLGQIPTILTTAMITQYAIVFWLICGLAVSCATRERGLGPPRNTQRFGASSDPPRQLSSHNQ